MQRAKKWLVIVLGVWPFISTKPARVAFPVEFAPLILDGLIPRKMRQMRPSLAGSLFGKSLGTSWNE